MGQGRALAGGHCLPRGGFARGASSNSFRSRRGLAISPEGRPRRRAACGNFSGAAPQLFCPGGRAAALNLTRRLSKELPSKGPATHRGCRTFFVFAGRQDLRFETNAFSFQRAWAGSFFVRRRGRGKIRGKRPPGPHRTSVQARVLVDFCTLPGYNKK